MGSLRFWLGAALPVAVIAGAACSSRAESGNTRTGAQTEVTVYRSPT